MTQSDKGQLTNAELADEIAGRVQREVEGELAVRIRVLTELPQIIAALRQSSDIAQKLRVLLKWPHDPRLALPPDMKAFNDGVHACIKAAAAEGHHE